MTPRFFVLFAACFAIAASANMSLDSQVLQEVFGNRNGPAPSQQAVPPQQAIPPLQAIPVTPSPPDDVFSPSPADYDQFDWTLTKRVAAVSDKNFLISPLGLKLALAILTEAATGVTQNELSSVLGFDLDRNVVRSKFSTIIESLQGNKYAMYIIVPNSLMGLPRVLNDIGGLRQEMENLREYTVDVTLPRFEFDYTSQLDGILRELGIRAAFEDTASFPGIARGQDVDQRLKVSKVLQRAGIVVNELGSVAYSITEISLVNKFGEDIEATAEVVADKPFLFFIQDEATRQLLFTGRVSQPHGQDGVLKV
ncbi:hypothetical protein HF086_004286 [Spodoptera exigua]|uniref:Serpin domain-containing protein n=1 Tax=Spodoptera exigua TaxID=7107 RepID=A0A922MX50_SPOEX|nr:hypothetical protein HF086_004286 [Spodoptera exigua]